MNFHTISVNKPSALEVGVWYLIKGTDPRGFPIPKQVVLIEGTPQQSPVTGDWHCDVALWASLGAGNPKIGPIRSVLFLRDVSAQEGDDCALHLERIDTALVRVAEKFGGVDDYHEVMKDRSSALRKADDISGG